MQFAQLLNLRELGVPVPAEILIESSTLQNKEQLINAIGQQEQQQAQMSQQQAQMQIELLKAQIEDLHARAVANQGLGHERASRIHENQALAVERRAAAVKDLEEADFDKIKGIKELAGMDMDTLHRAAEIYKMLTEKPEDKEKPGQKKKAKASKKVA
jgi:Rad3-related DNA helicase